MQIPASHLSGDISPSAADKVYMKLYYRQPEIKLLYVTPEKVNLHLMMHNMSTSVCYNLPKTKVSTRRVVTAEDSWYMITSFSFDLHTCLL